MPSTSRLPRPRRLPVILAGEAGKLSAGRRVRVMIADGHPIMRDGLREVLGRADDLEVVGEAADGETAVKLAASTQPDIVIMEAVLPGKDGIEACREIKEDAAGHPGAHTDGLGR